MKKLLTAIAALGLIGAPAFAADMAVKAPPPAPAPIPYSWTGFYAGIQFGGGWSNEAVNFTANDPVTANIVNGAGAFGALANGYRISQSGAVGGFEAGYNWQAGANWLLGLETDFSFAGMDGTASGTSVLLSVVTPPIFQTSSAQQKTEWYGTVRGRAGWLATPNLLLFGTGGFAYGRIADSANYGVSHTITFAPIGGVGAICVSGVPCFLGASSGIRTGWTAGGGIEYVFSERWTAKVEYQFVDLGTDTVPVIATTPAGGGTGPASFSAAFRDQFHVVRVGLNYQFH